MIGRLKALNLALLVVLALGALAAQAASAADSHQFKSDGQKTILTGKQVGAHEFAVGLAGTLKCSTATFESTIDAGVGQTEVDEITVKPSYGSCEFGGQAVTVFFNDCTYVFDSDTTAGSTTGGKHAKATIECAAGNVIKIHTVNCTITIGPQIIADSVTYTNDTASSITTSFTSHGVTVGKERSTAAQPVNGCLVFPTGAVGKYVGATTAECRTDEGSGQPSPTTPSGTVDATTTNCSVTEV